MNDEMDTTNNLDIDVHPYSSGTDRLCRPNNNKGETTLLNNLQQQFRLQPKLSKHIQRNTYSDKECYHFRIWIDKQVQPNFWNCCKRNENRELLIQLEQWGKLETDNSGGQ